MKTLIFDTYEDFKNREDKAINGVSPFFAKVNPYFEKNNETNKGCFNCFNCFDCVDCVDCVSCVNTILSNDCYNCFDCNSCVDCKDCDSCHYCVDCKRCDSLHFGGGEVDASSYPESED